MLEFATEAEDGMGGVDRVDMKLAQQGCGLSGRDAQESQEGEGGRVDDTRRTEQEGVDKGSQARRCSGSERGDEGNARGRGGRERNMGGYWKNPPGGKKRQTTRGCGRGIGVRDCERCVGRRRGGNTPVGSLEERDKVAVL